MKQCSKCLVLKDEAEFYRKKHRNQDALRADCKDCFRRTVAEYANKHLDDISDCKKRYYSENAVAIKARRSIIRGDKESIVQGRKANPCQDCGKHFPSCAMDFDHRDRDVKKCGIAIMLNTGYSVASLLKELDKCDLVCACCHRNRTYEYGRLHSIAKRRYPSREAKHKFINEYKSKPCADCSGRFNPWQMDFDHLDPSGKCFKLSKSVVTGYSFSQILEEMGKCDLVCVNCHRVRTEKRHGQRSQTGHCDSA